MYIYKVTILFVLVLNITLLAGCGDDSPNGPGTELTVVEGRYALDISGDLPGVTSGKARFWIGRPFGPANEQLFVIGLKGGTGGQDSLQVALIGVPERPETGTYSFLDYAEGNPENPEDQIIPGEYLLFGFYSEYENGETTVLNLLVSRSGTLTIIESSTERVSGTFSIEVTAGGEEGQTGSGTYEGEFIATPGDPDNF